MALNVIIFFYLAICYSNSILPLHIFITCFMCDITCVPYPGRHLFDWSNFESPAWYPCYPPSQNTGTQTFKCLPALYSAPCLYLQLLHIHCGLRVPELSDVNTQEWVQHQEPYAEGVPRNYILMHNHGCPLHVCDVLFMKCL